MLYMKYDKNERSNCPFKKTKLFNQAPKAMNKYSEQTIIELMNKQSEKQVDDRTF